MSSIDTRILGSTVAELVGVEKENQQLTFELVKALNKRNNPTGGLVHALTELLRTYDKTSKVLERRLQYHLARRLYVFNLATVSAVLTDATNDEDASLNRLAWEDHDTINNFSPIESWTDKHGHQRIDYDPLNPSQAMSLLDRICSEEICLLGGRIGLVLVDTRAGAFVFVVKDKKDRITLACCNPEKEKTFFTNVRIFALKKQKKQKK